MFDALKDERLMKKFKSIDLSKNRSIDNINVKHRSRVYNLRVLIASVIIVGIFFCCCLLNVILSIIRGTVPISNIIIRSMVTGFALIWFVLGLVKLIKENKFLKNLVATFAEEFEVVTNPDFDDPNRIKVKNCYVEYKYKKSDGKIKTTTEKFSVLYFEKIKFIKKLPIIIYKDKSYIDWDRL